MSETPNSVSIESFKAEVIALEEESLSNIAKIDDNVMISKIIKMYEGEQNDNQ